MKKPKTALEYHVGLLSRLEDELTRVSNLRALIPEREKFKEGQSDVFQTLIVTLRGIEVSPDIFSESQIKRATNLIVKCNAEIKIQQENNPKIKLTLNKQQI